MPHLKLSKRFKSSFRDIKEWGSSSSIHGNGFFLINEFIRDFYDLLIFSYSEYNQNSSCTYETNLDRVFFVVIRLFMLFVCYKLYFVFGL